MALLSWGKPRIFAKNLEETGAVWQELPTPAEGTTTLETTKGDKTEAKLEGGENEDVRYERNTYVLNATIRAIKGRVKPFADAEGIITAKHAICLQPEDPDVSGIMIERATISIEDTWSAADGGQWAYAFDALKPDNDKQLKWGKVVVSETTGGYEIVFTEDE